MTGRRLYDLTCDTRAVYSQSGYEHKPQYLPNEMYAWPFLARREREFWNELARRITPRSRKS